MADELTIDLQIAEVRREISMRNRAYPRWIAGGTLKQEKADYQMAALKAVLVTLESVKKSGPGTQGALTL